jgi:hypothetical protein
MVYLQNPSPTCKICPFHMLTDSRPVSPTASFHRHHQPYLHPHSRRCLRHRVCFWSVKTFQRLCCVTESLRLAHWASTNSWTQVVFSPFPPPEFPRSHSDHVNKSLIYKVYYRGRLPSGRYDLYPTVSISLSNPADFQKVSELLHRQDLWPHQNITRPIRAAQPNEFLGARKTWLEEHRDRAVRPGPDTTALGLLAGSAEDGGPNPPELTTRTRKKV